MEPIWFEDEEPNGVVDRVVKNLPDSVPQSPSVKNERGWKNKIKKQSSKLKLWIPTYEESNFPPSYEEATLNKAPLESRGHN